MPGFFLGNQGAGYGMAWSPDGSELYFMDFEAIYVVSADGWRLERMATAPPSSVGQDWSFAGVLTSLSVAPDANQLVYTACVDTPVEPTREGDAVVVMVGAYEGHHFDLFRASRDGASVERLTDSLNDESYAAWSPDGRRLAFLTNAGPAGESNSRLKLSTMAADGTDVRQVLSDEFAVLHDLPQWSPDGRHLAVVRYRNTRLISGIPIRGRETLCRGRRRCRAATAGGRRSERVLLVAGRPAAGVRASQRRRGGALHGADGRHGRDAGQ